MDPFTLALVGSISLGSFFVVAALYVSLPYPPPAPVRTAEPDGPADRALPPAVDAFPRAA